ncbi:Hypothetical protein, putative [Bodo saltans]|uniref:GAF domain-containing protein n=1 Tax=Bodo saltans TaxID=75058 RepID=A0A0S4J3D2_BODSA|nr:Hypothetical protein, putative [Bodo saltans]|eukprot:CUG07209.1 Hypothetical protein, putative [Bodo saltans]
MLELSHEVNYAMQMTSLRLKELCDAVQDGVDKCQQRVIQLKSVSTRIHGGNFRNIAVDHESTVSSPRFAGFTNAGGGGGGAVSSGSSQVTSPTPQNSWFSFSLRFFFFVRSVPSHSGGMLELSHEVNYAMQMTSLRLKELCDAVQDGVDKCQQRVIQLKSVSTRIHGGNFRNIAVDHESTVSSPRFAGFTNAGGGGGGAVSSGSSQVTSPLKKPDETVNAFNSSFMPPPTSSGGGGGNDVKLLDDVQSILRVVQRSALILSSAYESFSTALQIDVKRQTSQVQQLQLPLGRQVPHSSLPIVGRDESTLELPPIFQDSQRGGITSSQGGGVGSRSNGRLTSMSLMSQTNVLVPVPGAPQHDRIAPMKPAAASPRAPPGASMRSKIKSPPTKERSSGSNGASVTDQKTVDVLSTSLYFSFDALARALRAREAVAYVQRSPHEAQAVCVFGGKPRHPSFDALARALRAREAVAYVQRSPHEAQAVCVFGGKPRHPLTVKVPLKEGPVGAVMRSGVALNVVCDDPSIQSGHMLCFPIFESSSRVQPIGAIVVERNGQPSFQDSEAALVQLWAVIAAQFLTGYGTDLTTLPYDPYQGVLRQGGPLLEFLKAPQNKHNKGAFGVDATMSISAGASQSDRHAIASILGTANYSAGVAAVIASQTPPQLVFKASHRNHGAHMKPAMDWKGHTEMLRYQNVLDVALYIERLSDSWRRSTDDLQEMEVEQIAQMQDMKVRMRKLKTVTGKLENTERQVMEYKERYDVLKKELATLASE